jgi:sortase (surface protein transpeptidase)
LTAGALAVAGVSCVGFVLTHQVHPGPVPPRSTAAAATAATAVAAAPVAASPASALVLPASVPTELVIPAIRVRTSLLQLGQTAEGTLAVPAPGPHYDQAGWYRYSPTPGARGPAVIVGHIDSKRGGPSVFFRLGQLRPRDTIEVTRADGTVAVFAVDDVRRFRKTDFPTALVYGNTTHAALRLITCGGPFDDSSGHYLDNVVVTASLVRTA